MKVSSTLVESKVLVKITLPPILKLFAVMTFS